MHLPQFFHKKHRCKDCGADLSSYEDLVGHAKTEHKRSIMKCKMCHKEFLYESERWEHQKSHKK
ncbi:MAG TPA: hypothetical protein VI698_01030 [Nitrososphaerales archaeon]|nr:hypothetical protein [Nitrososphaerales archaeon]